MSSNKSRVFKHGALFRLTLDRDPKRRKPQAKIKDLLLVSQRARRQDPLMQDSLLSAASSRKSSVAPGAVTVRHNRTRTMREARSPSKYMLENSAKLPKIRSPEQLAQTFPTPERRSLAVSSDHQTSRSALRKLPTAEDVNPKVKFLHFSNEN